MSDLPAFKYHPNPVKTGVFQTDKTVTCSCCGNETDVYYCHPAYTADKDSLCPDCIHSGRANKELNWTFQDYANCDKVSDNEKLSELCNRTPGYISWQESYWLAHCDDYCAFIDYVGWEELRQMGIEKEIEDDLESNSHGFDLKDIKRCLFNNGDMQGYLFRCIHCGKYRLYVDCS